MYALAGSTLEGGDLSLMSFDRAGNGLLLKTVEGAGGDALMSGGRKSEQPILSMQDIHSLSEKHLLPVAHCGIVSIMASCDKEL